MLEVSSIGIGYRETVSGEISIYVSVDIALGLFFLCVCGLGSLYFTTRSPVWPSSTAPVLMRSYLAPIKHWFFEGFYWGERRSSATNCFGGSLSCFMPGTLQRRVAVLVILVIYFISGNKRIDGVSKEHL